MGVIQKIFKSDSSSGVLLLLVTLCAIAFANFGFLKDFYDAFIHFGINETYNMHFFVNDILMAIFFFYDRFGAKTRTFRRTAFALFTDIFALLCGDWWRDFSCIDIFWIKFWQ